MKKNNELAWGEFAFEDETWRSCRHLIESDQAYLAGTHHDVLHRIYVMLHYVQRL